MRLVQFKTASGQRRVGAVEDGATTVRLIEGAATVLELANLAIAEGASLADVAKARIGAETADYDQLLAEGRVLPPIDHPEPARFWITGTGLTHIGSASARDKMHDLEHGDQAAPMTDSMKIFRMGIEGGKPADGGVGVQPEWFYKGSGACVVAPEAPLPMPAFALAGGEEAEIVGLYLIGPDGTPYRLGYAIGNEFSDHVTEAINYLFLAHSKLRSCSFGPELLLGALPDHVSGHSRIIRDGKLLWEGEFLSGEGNMSHSIANLEHYHFRYPMFRRPGDLHAYFFGAAILSCAEGVKTEDGDLFEIEVPQLGRPLRNRLTKMPDEPVVVKNL